MKLKWHKDVNGRCSGFFTTTGYRCPGLFGDYSGTGFWARGTDSGEYSVRYSNLAIERIEKNDNESVLIAKFPAKNVHFAERNDI